MNHRISTMVASLNIDGFTLFTGKVCVRIHKMGDKSMIGSFFDLVWGEGCQIWHPCLD
jgi:hypothetical protein